MSLRECRKQIHLWFCLKEKINSVNRGISWAKEQDGLQPLRFLFPKPPSPSRSGKAEQKRDCVYIMRKTEASSCFLKCCRNGLCGNECPVSQRLSEENPEVGSGPCLSAGLLRSLRLAFLQLMLFPGRPSSHSAANPQQRGSKPRTLRLHPPPRPCL